MVVLGIDPGYGRVGYGIIDYTKNKYKAIEYGSITTKENTPLPGRLHKIEIELRSIIAIYEYTPLQAKLAIVGYGRAEKIQVKNMVKEFLKLQTMPKLDDTTDALAIAICHTNSYRLNSLIEK